MPLEQLLLSWKDHNGVLVSVFENLLKRNAFVDCTLAAEGQYLKAHKVVLSACSSYFELLFSQESEKNPIVILKDVKFQELEAVVNFMYRGGVEICEDRLTAFLEVAESLQIKGLGSDGKTQDSRGKSPSLKSSETTVPPKAHSRKVVTFSKSENTEESCITITIDSDKNSNESSSHHYLPHRETLGSSHFSSTLVPESSYSLASASACCPVGADINSEGDKVVNCRCLPPCVSIFPLGDGVPSDQITITIDSDKNSNESSSHHYLPHRETLGSSHFSSSLVPESSYSLASASACCPVGADINSDGDKVVNCQCLPPSVSIFPVGDGVASDVNTVVKSEPVTDVYLFEKSKETERDNVTMMEDQEDWDDPNVEYDSRGKSPSLKSSETTVPAKAHSRKVVTFSESENTEEESCINITIDSDKNSNKSSSHHYLPHRETLGSSHFSSTLVPESSYSLTSASACCPVGADINSDGDKVVNSQCSPPCVSIFPVGDGVPSNVNTVVKSKPVTDMYLDEKSKDTERDDVMMTEDQEDWEDPNLEYVGDDHASNPDDPGISVTHMKTEETTSAPVENISSEGISVTHMKTEETTSAPVEHISSEGVPEGSAQRGITTAAPRWGRYLCHECGYSTSNYSKFSRHLFAHMGGVPEGSAQRGITPAAPQSGRYLCHECGFSVNHMTAEESTSAPVEHITSEGGVPAGSAQHGITRAASRGGRYQCHNCSYSTSTSWCLSRHQLVHTGEKPYKCTVCTFATTTQSNLKLHMRTHTGEKPYKCTICTYAATHQTSLKNHMRTHTGEKPYKCTVCTFATSLQDTLRKHMRIHTGEKPYKCTVCTFATTKQRNLKTHMRIHTGEKPYKCTVCTYATSQQVTLKRHVRTHTGEKPY